MVSCLVFSCIHYSGIRLNQHQNTPYQLKMVDITLHCMMRVKHHAMGIEWVLSGNNIQQGVNKRKIK